MRGARHRPVGEKSCDFKRDPAGVFGKEVRLHLRVVGEPPLPAVSGIPVGDDRGDGEAHRAVVKGENGGEGDFDHGFGVGKKVSEARGAKTVPLTFEKHRRGALFNGVLVPFGRFAALKRLGVKLLAVNDGAETRDGRGQGDGKRVDGLDG